MSNWWVYQWDSCLSVLKLTVQSISSVQLLSLVRLFVTPWTVAHWLPCPSPISGAYSNSCPLRQWCHPTISSSVIPFSSYLQSFPTSRSFQMSQFFVSGGQSIGVSASASVLPMNNQDSFPLGWTGWISLLSKGLFFFFLSWRLITLQYCSGFCHTLTWISHGFTCIPRPDPPSHLPLHTIPLGLPSAPGPSTCLMHPA